MSLNPGDGGWDKLSVLTHRGPSFNPSVIPLNPRTIPPRIARPLAVSRIYVLKLVQKLTLLPPYRKMVRIHTSGDSFVVFPSCT